jgi:hypothetical protein
MNKRTKSDKTFHLVLSFPEGERLSNADLSAIEERFCEALGFREHQRISVVHDDTDHLHIHIAINKIHPRKLTIHNPYYDYKKVATLCEQIEQEFGLTQVNHETKLDKSSRIIRDIEAKAGIESLLGWIRRECLDDIKRANTWQGLHQLLQNHGLAIKERGNGLVFVSSHGVAVKASYVDRSLSKPNLIKRLGPFKAATHTAQTTYAQSKQYQPRPLQNSIDTSGLFERYQQQQADAASWRKDQWRTLREQRDRLIERAKKDAKRKRSIIKQVQASQLVKKALYATVSGQFKTTLDDIKREYRAAYAQLKTSQRRMSWLDWLITEAKNGNAEALSALRARSKKDSRIVGNHIAGGPKCFSAIHQRSCSVNWQSKSLIYAHLILQASQTIPEDRLKQPIISCYGEFWLVLASLCGGANMLRLAMQNDADFDKRRQNMETELLQSDTPIGIDHDFNGIGVLQRGYDVTCIAFKLAFGAFSNRQSG